MRLLVPRSEQMIFLLAVCSGGLEMVYPELDVVFKNPREYKWIKKRSSS